MERKRNTSGFDPGDKGSIPFRVTNDNNIANDIIQK